ncbi:hypothetical protein NQ314_012908 [Rhamnusium bicolor]|uniref:Thaumatin-like protein n=1 Tax=Rhamnusium bicolor TaxID=1586634 RepID=A0AAV8X9V5_9CUCU|nr:hypothetical protein NQ314_012908 [Rhamnusium bicolor]
MFTKIIVTVFLLAVTYCRVLQVRNAGSVPLLISVTGQSDLTLLSETTALVTVEDDFAGSISAIPSGSERFDIPRTKAELTLSVAGDSYAVSLKDGFNLKAKLGILGSRIGISLKKKVRNICFLMCCSNSRKNCSSALCSANLNTNCPIANKVFNSLGDVVACKNSPLVFKAICPKAIVSSDDTGVLTCQAASYLVLLG